MKLEPTRILSYLTITLVAAFAFVAVLFAFSLFWHVSVDPSTASILAAIIALISPLSTAFLETTYLEPRRRLKQLEAEKAARREVLSERETELLYEIYDCVDGSYDAVMSSELYEIADKLHLSDDEIRRYVTSFIKRKFVNAEFDINYRVALMELTPDGVDFVVFTRGRK
jgi:hypothetical protein